MFPDFLKPFSHHDHPREIIRQFTPNWFTVTMGTGAFALTLNQFPVNLPILHRPVRRSGWPISCSSRSARLLYAARWIFFPRGALAMFDHPVMPMFLGAIPMGLATIVNGFLAFGIARIGPQAVEIAASLWWVDAVLAIGVGMLLPFLMFTRQKHSLESMTAVWLLPIVACEVTAASGGLLAVHLANAQAAAHLLFFSYILWSFSVPLALGILVVLFLRLVLHKLPKREMAVSSWLSLGPLGTGALGLLVLGHDAPAILGAVGLGEIGEVAHGIGIIGGLMLWAYGAWWLVMAVAMTLSYLREGLPFNMGWWGFTFPLAVYTLATLNLGVQTGMGFFTVLGGIFVIALACLWLIVSVRTLAGGYRGHLFAAPCLAAQNAKSHEAKPNIHLGQPLHTS